MNNIVKQIITCGECSNFLEKPVLLPCGSSVCYKHLNGGPFFCSSCEQEHDIDKNNIMTNKAVDILIKSNLKNLNLGSDYHGALDLCNKLENTAKDMQTLRNEPIYFIKQTIDLFRNKTQLIREEHKLTIDQMADSILQRLDDYESECLSNIHSSQLKSKIAKIDEQIRKIKENLLKWQKTLSDFGTDVNEWKTIGKLSDEANARLNMEIIYLKKDLLGLKLNDYFTCVSDFQTLQLTSNANLENVKDQFKDIMTHQDISDSKIIDKNGVKELLELCKFPSDVKSKLIYRASEHGFTAEDFHSKCDNVTKTLTVIKSTSGCIFGGFTSQAWDQSNAFKADPDAFLFSLVNPENEPEKLIILNSSKAIYCHSKRGPIFGKGPDLLIRGQTRFSLISNSSFLGNSYPKRNSTRKQCKYMTDSFEFNLNNIEIYKII